MSNKLRKEVPHTDDEIIEAFGGGCTIADLRFTRNTIDDFKAYRGHCTAAGTVALNASNTLIVEGMQFWPSAAQGRLIVVDFGTVRGVLEPHAKQPHVEPARPAWELAAIAVAFLGLWGFFAFMLHARQLGDGVYPGMVHWFSLFGAAEAFRWAITGVYALVPPVLALSIYDALVPPSARKRWQ